MAKADPKNTPASQRSKCRPPKPEKIVVLSIGDARYLDDPDELVRRSSLEAIAWHRERKERYFRPLIETADKAKMTDRKWFRVSEIADGLSTLPGTIIPDTAKREGLLTFLCQEILRGAFNDEKERSQVANLHPSPLAPVRFNTKGITRADILKSEHLWIRRQACLDWFARKKLKVPEDWVSSGPDAPNTPNDSLPTSPARHHPDQPSAKPLADQCWKVPDNPPPQRQRELRHAWFVSGKFGQKVDRRQA